MPLCSYHAYNRCDRAGLAVKLVEVREEAMGNPSESAREVADNVNSHLGNEDWAYFFDKIDRGPNVFPAENRCGLLRAPQWGKIGEFMYCSDGVAFDSGIVMVRTVAGEGAFRVYDMLESNRLCEWCSQTQQKPTKAHAGGAVCPREEAAHSKGEIIHPLNSRIIGDQYMKRPAPVTANHKVLGEFPCKMPGCPNKGYKTASGANKHMLKDHTSRSLEPYEAAKSSVARGRRKRVRPLDSESQAVNPGEGQEDSEGEFSEQEGMEGEFSEQEGMEGEFSEQESSANPDSEGEALLSDSDCAQEGDTDSECEAEYQRDKQVCSAKQPSKFRDVLPADCTVSSECPDLSKAFVTPHDQVIRKFDLLPGPGWARGTVTKQANKKEVNEGFNYCVHFEGEAGPRPMLLTREEFLKSDRSALTANAGAWVWLKKND